MEFAKKIKGKTLLMQESLWGTKNNFLLNTENSTSLITLYKSKGSLAKNKPGEQKNLFTSVLYIKLAENLLPYSGRAQKIYHVSGN